MNQGKIKLVAEEDDLKTVIKNTKLFFIGMISV